MNTYTLLSVEKMNSNRSRHLSMYGINKPDFVHHEVKPLKNPSTFSLKSKVVNVYDQKQTGSCTANAICQAYNILGDFSTFQPSRMYLYYKERLVENNNSSRGISDTGADAADGLNWIQKIGICSESDWPYVESNANISPPCKCDCDAVYHSLSGIASLDQPNNANYTSNLSTAIKNTLVEGYPVLIGVQVYDSFMASTSGHIPMPDTNAETLQGGHEILITGYSDATSEFQFVNSWGNTWGDEGFGYLPYSYITDKNLTQEFRYFTKVINLPQHKMTVSKPDNEQLIATLDQLLADTKKLSDNLNSLKQSLTK